MKKVFNNLEEYILIALFPMITIIVFISTVVRYLKLGSIPWSEELARYIMVWIAYIGASLGIKRKAHLGVEIVVNMLPEKLQNMAKYLRVAIILVFNVLIILYSQKIMNHQMNMGQISPSLAMPIWVAYLAIPTGALLMGIRTVQLVVCKDNEVVK